jgi:hypothetical protein
LKRTFLQISFNDWTGKQGSNVTSFLDKVNILAFTCHEIEGQFQIITLSQKVFHAKITVLSDLEDKGKGIGPKGVAQTPSTQNSAYEQRSHNKREAGKTDSILYLADAQSLNHGHEGPGNLQPTGYIGQRSK